MQGRTVLVIHKSVETRQLLRRFVYSELSDVEMHEADALSTALDCLDNQRYDAIVCEQKPAGAELAACREALLEKAPALPFLVLVSSTGEEDLAALRACEDVDTLVTPFSSLDFAHRINELCDPKIRREHERVFVPGTRATFSVVGDDQEASVINMSRGGILTSMPFFADFASLFGCTTISMTFPAEATEEGSEKTLSVWAEFVRMIVIGGADGQAPKHLRTSWRFLDIEEEDRAVFNSILRRARDELSSTRLS